MNDNKNTSAASVGFEYDIDTDIKGFDGKSAEEYIAAVTGLGLTRSEELTKLDGYSDFFRDPKVMATFTEHFDMNDKRTRRAILSFNESDQASVLTSLTSRLYDHIVSKVDDIDYGDIPSTEGDITKLSNYNKLTDCVSLMKDILREYKQDTTPIDNISIAISNISSRKDLFSRAFKLNVELPIIMYNIMTLAVINAVSYMISTCIEFIKTPNRDSFDITLDKVAYNKTKNNLVYNNLKKFNKSCDSGEFDKAMNHVITNTIRGIKESGDMIMMNEGIAATAALIVGAIPILIILFGLISTLLKELVFLFFHLRMRVSEFFDVQADLLQMNVYKIQSDDTKDEEEKERIISRQLKIVEFFRKASNKFIFTTKKAEVETEKDINKSNNDKIKIDDINGASSVLF